MRIPRFLARPYWDIINAIISLRRLQEMSAVSVDKQLRQISDQLEHLERLVEGKTPRPPPE
jgi:hypothetical protein